MIRFLNFLAQFRRETWIIAGFRYFYFFPVIIEIFHEDIIVKTTGKVYCSFDDT